MVIVAVQCLALAAIVFGIALVSGPAAWIVGGAFALVIAEAIGRHRGRREAK